MWLGIKIEIGFWINCLPTFEGQTNGKPMSEFEIKRRVGSFFSMNFSNYSKYLKFGLFWVVCDFVRYASVYDFLSNIKLSEFHNFTRVKLFRKFESLLASCTPTNIICFCTDGITVVQTYGFVSESELCR